MRFYCAILLFTSRTLCGPAPSTEIPGEPFIREIQLGEKKNYFAFVNGDGALNLTYEGAERLCARYGGEVWDINDGELLVTGDRRADQQIARTVLDELRKQPEVVKAQLPNEVLSRLNVVFGNRDGLEDGKCKWYLAGPYTNDFYTFTYYDPCPKKDEPGALSWFVCQKPEGTASSSEPPTDRTTLTQAPEPIPTSPSSAADIPIIEDIHDTIINATDATELIGNVTEDIGKLEEPVKGLREFQEDFIVKIVDLIEEDPNKASDATRVLLSDTVPEIASKIADGTEFVSVLKFVSNITSRISKFTNENTTITNKGSGSPVPYLFQHVKVERSRAFESTVESSRVETEFTGEIGDETILTTHMEFQNTRLQTEMISGTYKGTETFSSDLVEFSARFRNGTPYNVSVDLFFERQSKQAKRVATHECVFYNVEEGILDGTGCEFVEVTTDGRVHCLCYHTTTFGSIFSPESFTDSLEMALDIFSFIIDPFSLTALLLSILVFSLVRQIRTVLTVIHLNLCICLFVSELIIVMHNLVYISSEGFRCNPYVGALVHYSFLTIIAWSTLEGVYILQLMIVVFKPPESHTRYYLMIGYLLPALFPLIGAILGTEYTTQSGQLCFLHKETRGLFWTFLAPLMIMLSVNVVALSSVMYRLCTVSRNVKTVRSELLRYLRGVLCMTALLGLQWGLGVISLSFDWTPLKFTCILLFVFLTLAQGPLIFVVHIMLVKDTRYALARYLSKRGRFSRCLANFIRPPPPTTEMHLHRGSSSTKTTEVMSSNHSSSAPQTPVASDNVIFNPLGNSQRV